MSAKTPLVDGFLRSLCMGRKHFNIVYGMEEYITHSYLLMS